MEKDDGLYTYRAPGGEWRMLLSQARQDRHMHWRLKPRKTPKRRGPRRAPRAPRKKAGPYPEHRFFPKAEVRYSEPDYLVGPPSRIHAATVKSRKNKILELYRRSNKQGGPKSKRRRRRAQGRGEGESLEGIVDHGRTLGREEILPYLTKKYGGRRAQRRRLVRTGKRGGRYTLRFSRRKRRSYRKYLRP